MEQGVANVGKLVSTLVTVVIAVGASAAIWVGANLLFDQVRRRWNWFTGIAFGIVGFLGGMLLSGNRITRGSDGGLLEWIWLPLVGAVAIAAFALVLGQLDDPRTRQIVAIVTAGVIGVAVGLLIRPELHPSLEIVPIVIWTAAGAALGGLLDWRAGHRPVRRTAVGATLGVIIGVWGAGTLGDGSLATALVGTTVPALLLGVRIGATSTPDRHARTALDTRSRAVIFLGPALLFILATLVVPSIRTGYLSLLDNRSDAWVGLANYQAIFTDPTSWNAANWTDMFGSRLMWLGLAVLAVTVVIGIGSKRQTGRAVELGGPSMMPLVIGLVLVSFAVLTAVRGTIANNVWWVIAVTFASTAAGLAVAVLADGAKFEKVAKSIIFMPMAISLVGASIIWRFMYRSRDPSLEQTGVMNAAWVSLGRLSTGRGIPTYIAGVLIFLALSGLGVLLARHLVRRQYAALVVPALGFGFVLWIFIRYLTSGVGGVTTAPNGERVSNPIQFIQETPFNNFWLMVILIWIQTGFAMVILSAAIRAVPEEYLEAARVDGATQSQIFWRIILPQIATTIGVVMTTLVVLVMKVYDIVRVVTNGNFGTQVLANDMFQQAFSAGRTGRGAALAMLILLSVLPVMYFNIRRTQREV